ncbi:MAG: tetratricopeptide repeat protein [Deltaproteobacteria bacterium]|nr:tetratricopeptide repeat protein [Deltaproteobacteria bacterium]
MIKTKRFQTWELSPSGKIEGMWPVPEGAKPHRYCEIDTDKDIVEIREWVEGSEKPLVRKPVFEKGKLQYSNYSDPLTGLVGKNSYEYNAKGFLAARQEVDPKGKLRFRIVVTCDDQGRFREEKIHDRTKRLKERRVYEPDAKGRPLRDTVYKGKDGQELDGHFELGYDAKGRLIKRSWFDASGSKKSTFSYEYDSADRQIELEMEREGGTTIAKMGYDALGRRAKTEYFSGDGKKLGVETVDEKGGVHHETFVPMGEQTLPPARQPLHQTVSVSPDQVAALRMVGYALLENGKYEDARAVFESIVAVDPEDPYAMAGVGATEMAKKRPDVALEWYERALGHDATHLPSLLGKAEAELTKGQVDKALETFKTLFAAAPTQDDPFVARARGIVLAISKAGRT